MILDTLGSIGNYMLPAEYAAAMLEFAAGFEKEPLPGGKYPLLGDRLFALVQRYETKPPDGARMEAHRLYADVQYIASGEEYIFSAPRCDAPPEDDKTPESDIMFYSVAPANCRARLAAGLFALYLPGELHMPCIMTGDAPAGVVKLVFKLEWPVKY